MIPALRRALGLVLLLVPVVAFASPDRALDLDDVLRLHYAGVSEDIIISEIIVTDSVFLLSVDDILRLQEAGLSERLLQFLVDTGRDVEPDGTIVAEEDGTLYADDSETPYYDEWVNEIEVAPTETSYYVSLNYSYPTWWYDCYWYDYWYWDFHYYPYSCSWVGYLGAWYPAWYGYRTCWVPAYWGYRSWYYDRWGYPWWAGSRYCSANDGFYYAGYGSGHYGGHYRDGGLSQTKTKSNLGGSSGTGYPLYADAGLKLPDGGRLQVTGGKTPVDLRGKLRDGRVAVSDRPDGRDDKRPVRTPTDSVKLPEGPGGRKPATPTRSALGAPDTDRTPTRPTPVRDVRAPADGGRPIRVRTLSEPAGEIPDPPSRTEDTPTRPIRTAPQPQTSPDPPDRGTPSRGNDTPPPAVKSPPKPAPAPTPKASPPPRTSPPPRSVKPAPAPSPAPKASPPRSSPPRSSSPPARSKGGSPAPSKPKGRR
jgi:hypothetical protein